MNSQINVSERADLNEFPMMFETFAKTPKKLFGIFFSKMTHSFHKIRGYILKILRILECIVLFSKEFNLGHMIDFIFSTISKQTLTHK